MELQEFFLEASKHCEGDVKDSLLCASYAAGKAAEWDNFKEEEDMRAREVSEKRIEDELWKERELLFSVISTNRKMKEAEVTT